MTTCDNTLIFVLRFTKSKEKNPTTEFNHRRELTQHGVGDLDPHSMKG